MPTLWCGWRPSLMKALATVTMSLMYSAYVHFTQTPFLLTARAVLSGTLATVSWSILQRDFGGMSGT